MAKRAYQKKYHFIYKTTRFDGKYYIGIHSTDDLEDGYKGSGTHIGRSLRYHGKDKHVREILEFLPSRDALVDREGDVVTLELIKDGMCMNIDPGGRGSRFVSDEKSANIKAKVKDLWKNEERLNKMRKSIKDWWTPGRRKTQSEFKKKQHEDPLVIENISKGTKVALSTSEIKRNMSIAKKSNWKDPVYRETQIAKQNLGKQSESYRQKQSAAKSGSNNPNFGLCWVYNEDLRQSKRIPKHEAVPNGWNKGRKIFKEKT